MQWIEEAKSKLENPGLVYAYHGASRKRNPQTLVQNSIVVTTYETLASDRTYHAVKSNDADYCAPCEQIRWWRIICDESHGLRSANTGKTQAVMDLQADNKWLVTGTPINTTVIDLKNQLNFIGIENTTQMMETFRSSFFRDIRDPSQSKKTTHLALPGRGLVSMSFLLAVLLQNNCLSTHPLIMALAVQLVDAQRDDAALSGAAVYRD